MRRQDASHRARVVALVRDRLQRNVGNTARCKRIFYTIYALCTAKPSSHDTTISTTASTSTSTVPPAPMANTAASFVNPYRIEFEQLLPALLRQLAADASRSMAAALKSATPRPAADEPLAWLAKLFLKWHKHRLFSARTLSYFCRCADLPVSHQVLFDAAKERSTNANHEGALLRRRLPSRLHPHANTSE